MTHNGHPHLVDLNYCERANIIGRDCPSALLHITECPCGADTVHPYEPQLIALMRDEWGIVCRVDEAVRERVLSLTYDPVVREDIASREVWAEAVGL